MSDVQSLDRQALENRYQDAVRTLLDRKSVV